MMNTFKTLIVALASLAAVSATAQSADEIINKHIDAMGGKEKLAALKTVKMEGSMTTQGVDVGLTMTKKQMEGLRLDLEIMGTANYQVMNTKKGSVFMPIMQQTDPQDMPEAQYNGGKSQMDIQGALFNYKEKGNKITYEGLDTIQGKKAYKLKVDKDGSVSTYFVDADSYYVVKTETVTNVNGQNMDIETTYADFKKNEDGYVFPYSLTNMQGTILWDKILTNVPVDSKLFDN